MSVLFGPMRQLGYVVDDLQAAVAWWVAHAKIGPWFCLDHAVLPKVAVGGVEYKNMSLAAAFANSGDMQIELIEQKCETPSIYKGAAAPVGGRLHHWSSWPDPAAYGVIRRRALDAGYRIEMEVGEEFGGFVYFSKDKGGPYIEMSSQVEWRKAFFRRVREAAQDWDGSDPVRDRRGRPLP